MSPSLHISSSHTTLSPCLHHVIANAFHNHHHGCGVGGFVHLAGVRAPIAGFRRHALKISRREYYRNAPCRISCSGSDGSWAGDGALRGKIGNESGLDVEDEEEEIGVQMGDFGKEVERWDVLGLGQAMVDFSGVVSDEFLESLGLEKGTRKVVNHEERGKVLRAMDGCSYKAAAGGSLSNSLVALARLGSWPVGGPILNVAMAGSIGSDPLGGFYRSKLHRAGVHFLSSPVNEGTTGTVIVLTTPDAQRTMLAYQGTSSSVSYDPCLCSTVTKTNILVVEGYLFELPDTIRTIAKACKDAHGSGALVAVAASDVSCIERHFDDYWEIIGNYADILFANSNEARALCHFAPNESPISAARYLSHFLPLVSVTDGPGGSYIGMKGEAVYIPPSPCTPVDTCGAGDAYASGILYSVLRGVSELKDMGTFASRVAAVVVQQQGTRLRVQDAVELADSFESHTSRRSRPFDQNTSVA
ncbi:putative sugar kinase [Drosera capensis]